MKKLDLKKELKTFYQPRAREAVQVDVPIMNFLMVDGEGDPNTSQSYAEAVEALFAVSYSGKFLVKKGPLAIDYGVMPLESLWWADEMSKFSPGDRSSWKWTAMIMQPSFITREIIDRAVADTTRRKRLPAISRLRFEEFAEGHCAQILHIGPFSAEGPTIERLHQFIAGRGERTGKHHEIYLTDIRRADPSRWKTIIRQPMRRRPACTQRPTGLAS